MKKNLFFLFALLSFTSAMAQHADSHKEFDAYAKIYQEGSFLRYVMLLGLAILNGFVISTFEKKIRSQN